jgi:hypothetical protein
MADAHVDLPDALALGRCARTSRQLDRRGAEAICAHADVRPRDRLVGAAQDLQHGLLDGEAPRQSTGVRIADRVAALGELGSGVDPIEIPRRVIGDRSLDRRDLHEIDADPCSHRACFR